MVSLDLDPKTDATICADVCSWEPMPMFASGYFDMIWVSPPCTEDSRALTRWPRRLEKGDRTATLELIRDLRPRFWCIQNPQLAIRARAARYPRPGGRHPAAAQRGTFRRRGEVVQNCQSQGQLYSIPEALCSKIAPAVNARVVTSAMSRSAAWPSWASPAPTTSSSR